MIKSATRGWQGCHAGVARARIAHVADMADLVEVVNSSLSSSSLPRGSLTHLCHGSLIKSANSATLPRVEREWQCSGAERQP
jgi:hypothetical protein